MYVYLHVLVFIIKMLEAIHHIERKLRSITWVRPIYNSTGYREKNLQIQQPKCIIGSVLTHTRGKQQLTKHWKVKERQRDSCFRHPRTHCLSWETLKTPSFPVAGLRPRQIKTQRAGMARISHIAFKHGPAMVQHFVHFQIWATSADSSLRSPKTE